MGYADVGFHGCQDIPTPNLDALAKASVRCTNGYVSGPYCSPTRAGLMTGRYQTRFGHEFNAGAAGLGLAADRNDDRRRGSKRPAMPRASSASGIWAPSRNFIRKSAASTSSSASSAERTTISTTSGILRGTQQVDEKEYLTDAFGREAVAFIEKHKSESWFLYLAFNAVHTPMQADDPRLKKFAHISDKQRRTYAAMMSAMDDAIGSVRKKLDETGLAQNTLVTFISDNGGPTMPGTTINASSNKPLRGSKRTTLEGGIRVPFLVSWPGHVKPGVYDKPVIQLDLTATALTAAGVAHPARLEARRRRSCAVLLRDRMRPRRMSRCIGGLASKWRSATAITSSSATTRTPTRSPAPAASRSARRKLYRLSDDIGEAKDLAASMPDKLNELQAKWDAWNKDNVASAVGRRWRRRGRGEGKKAKKGKAEVK